MRRVPGFGSSSRYRAQAHRSRGQPAGRAAARLRTARPRAATIPARSPSSRTLQLAPAARAEGVVDLRHPPAAWAAPAQLVALGPVDDRRNQADHGHDRRDQKPQPERAALDLADDPAGQPEAERDDRRSASSSPPSEQDAQRPDDPKIASDHDDDAAKAKATPISTRSSKHPPRATSTPLRPYDPANYRRKTQTKTDSSSTRVDGPGADGGTGRRRAGIAGADDRRITVRPGGNRHPARRAPLASGRGKPEETLTKSPVRSGAPHERPRRPSSRAMRSIATSTALVPERRPTLASL